jgi:oligoendopeptidase F
MGLLELETYFDLAPEESKYLRWQVIQVHLAHAIKLLGDLQMQIYLMQEKKLSLPQADKHYWKLLEKLYGASDVIDLGNQKFRKKLWIFTRSLGRCEFLAANYAIASLASFALLNQYQNHDPKLLEKILDVMKLGSQLSFIQIMQALGLPIKSLEDLVPLAAEILEKELDG